MNKRGFAYLLTLMISIVIIILALAFAPVVKQFNDEARNETTSTGGTGLDCDNSSISDYDKATCVATDVSFPTFIGILIAIGIAVIGGRIILG